MVRFQQAVRTWIRLCFGDAIAYDKAERNRRFLEESLELVQSLGMSKAEALFWVEYVYGRDVGEPRQEVGGVRVCLAALCNANGMDEDECGEHELIRISDPAVVEKIRHKHANKPTFQPSPDACPHLGPFEQGPRIPLSYGSAATLICKACGSWRQERQRMGPWRTRAELDAALEEPERE